MADILFNKFKSANSNKICMPTGKSRCENCDVELCDEDIMKKHIQTNHQWDSSFQCHNCGQKYTDSETLKRHNETDHIISIHNSKFGCLSCDQTFLNENSLMNHMNEHHKTNLLEKTFFNPSARLWN